MRNRRLSLRIIYIIYFLLSHSVITDATGLSTDNSETNGSNSDTESEASGTDTNAPNTNTNESNEKVSKTDEKASDTEEERNTSETEANESKEETNASETEVNSSEEETNASETEANESEEETNTSNVETDASETEVNSSEEETNASKTEAKESEGETNASETEINASKEETNVSETDTNESEEEKNTSDAETSASETETNASNENTNDSASEEDGNKSEKEVNASETETNVSEEETNASETETNTSDAEANASESEKEANVSESETNASEEEQNSLETETSDSEEEANESGTLQCYVCPGVDKTCSGIDDEGTLSTCEGSNTGCSVTRTIQTDDPEQYVYQRSCLDLQDQFEGKKCEALEGESGIRCLCNTSQCNSAENSIEMFENYSVTNTNTTNSTKTTTEDPGFQCYSCSGENGLCDSEADEGRLTTCWTNQTTCTVVKLTETQAQQNLVMARGCGIPGVQSPGEKCVEFAVNGASGHQCTCNTSQCNSVELSSQMFNRAEAGISGSGTKCYVCSGADFTCENAEDTGTLTDCGEGVKSCLLGRANDESVIARGCGIKEGEATLGCNVGEQFTVCVCDSDACNRQNNTDNLFSLATTTQQDAISTTPATTQPKEDTATEASTAAETDIAAAAVAAAETTGQVADKTASTPTESSPGSTKQPSEDVTVDMELLVNVVQTSNTGPGVDLSRLLSSKIPQLESLDVSDQCAFLSDGSRVQLTAEGIFVYTQTDSKVSNIAKVDKCVQNIGVLTTATGRIINLLCTTILMRFVS